MTGGEEVGRMERSKGAGGGEMSRSGRETLTYRHDGEKEERFNDSCLGEEGPFFLLGYGNVLK